MRMLKQSYSVVTEYLYDEQLLLLGVKWSATETRAEIILFSQRNRAGSVVISDRNNFQFNDKITLM